MEKIFHSTFDFFSHALPGLFIIGAFFVLGEDVSTLRDVFNQATQIPLEGGIILLALGYVIGFLIYPFGRIMYKKIGFRIWNKKIENNVELRISDKYALIREYSPNNFKYIELWNMYCALAHNLSIFCIVFSICCLIKFFILSGDNTNAFSWIVVALLSLFCFFILLYRAVVFSLWAADDINSSLSKLEFGEKGIGL